MKKIIVSLLIALLLILLLPACREEGDPDTEQNMTIVVHATSEDGFIGRELDSENEIDIFVKCEGANEEMCRGERVEFSYMTGSYLTQSGTFKGEVDEGVEVTLDYDAVLEEMLEYKVLPDPGTLTAKPVIYLYPETEIKVSVSLDYDGTFTVTIPPYQDGWTVTASPDGTLTAEDGQTYPYLFWEGYSNQRLTDITCGSCVAGDETEAFLADVLLRLGLNEHEAAEFMEYWVPRMKDNPYNLIQFRYEDYTEMAELTVTPTPDSVLRVYMTYSASDIFVDLPAQEIRPFERKGFAVIEWGGGEL